MATKERKNRISPCPINVHEYTVRSRWVGTIMHHRQHQTPEDDLRKTTNLNIKSFIYIYKICIRRVLILHGVTTIVYIIYNNVVFALCHCYLFLRNVVVDEQNHARSISMFANPRKQ